MVKIEYVLVTPARNEAQFIERTIRSVVDQTVRPLKWVIVSDGSTDGTDEIVRKYAREYPWIELVALFERKERHFAGKVHAFNSGHARVRDLHYEIIGSLDADLAFEPDYFEFLLTRFRENPLLGVAGTPFREGDATYDFRFTNIEHVSGACQMFRRACFEEIGGYVPIREGGIDLVAVLTARMKGWQTRTYIEKTCEHLKRTQHGEAGIIKRSFRSGYHDYLMGNPLLFQMARSLYQTVKRPVSLGGCMLLCGYLWALLRRAKRPISRELVAFRRHEQMGRLKALFSRPLRAAGACKAGG